MRIKVHNGTAAQTGASLCETCRHSILTRGRAYHEEIVRCHADPMAAICVTFKVTACSAYEDEREPTYMQFVQQAWILRPGGRKRRPGFVRSSDLDPEEV